MLRTTSILLLALSLSACAGGNLRPTDVSRSDARTPEAVQEGTVEQVYKVTLRSNTEVAQGVGAAVGGYAANRASKDTHEAVQVLATAAGVMVGSVVGDSVSDLALDKSGINLIVRLDSGSTIAISQQTDSRADFTVGDRVYLIGSGNQIRVLPKK